MCDQCIINIIDFASSPLISLVNIVICVLKMFIDFIMSFQQIEKYSQPQAEGGVSSTPVSTSILMMVPQICRLANDSIDR